MATITLSNEFKYELGKGTVDFSSDTFKIILMDSGFVFDPDTDGQYSDVSADEIGSTGGYTVGGVTLTVDDAWAQDNANNQALMTWVDKAFTASGAAYDTFCAAIIYDDSVSSPADLIVGCIAYDSDIDIADGSTFTATDLGVTI